MSPCSSEGQSSGFLNHVSQVRILPGARKNIINVKEKIMLRPRKKLIKKHIKEDKLVTSYFKAMDYVEQNSKMLLIAAAVVLAVMVISILYFRSKKNAEMRASVELTKAQIELSKNNVDTAIDMLKSLADNYSGTQNAGKGVFYLANIYFERQNTEEASNYFQKYLNDYSDDSILTSSAYSGVAACYERKEELLKAAGFYLKGAEKYPKHFEAPEQLMKAARCYKLANNKLEARKLYQKVIDDYPQSQQKANAELYLSELQG